MPRFLSQHNSLLYGFVFLLWKGQYWLYFTCAFLLTCYPSLTLNLKWVWWRRRNFYTVIIMIWHPLVMITWWVHCHWPIGLRIDLHSHIIIACNWVRVYLVSSIPSYLEHKARKLKVPRLWQVPVCFCANRYKHQYSKVVFIPPQM